MEENKKALGLISVIVPVYNVEDYLEYTLDSIINQDIDTWELLLVNDGSEDKSGEICDRYASANDRVHVFHTSNRGVSHARNIGIQHSRGEYIVFCDSDDLVAPNYLSSLKEKIVSSGADIVRCGKNFIAEDTRFFLEGNHSLGWKVYEKSDITNLHDYMYHVIWGKIYRKSLIVNNHILFDESLNRGEDSLFAFQTTLCCNRVVYSDNEYINYRVRNNSLMRTFASVPLYDQSVRMYYQLCEFNKGREHNQELWNQYRIIILVSIAENLVRSVVDKRVFTNNYIKFCADVAVRQAIVGIKSKLTKKTKFAIEIMSLIHMPRTTSVIRQMLKIIYV